MASNGFNMLQQQHLKGSEELCGLGPTGTFCLSRFPKPTTPEAACDKPSEAKV